MRVGHARQTLSSHIAALISQRTPQQARGAIGPVSSIAVEKAYPPGGVWAEAINTSLIEGGAMLGMAGFVLVSAPWLAATGLGTMSCRSCSTEAT